MTISVALREVMFDYGFDYDFSFQDFTVNDIATDEVQWYFSVNDTTDSVSISYLLESKFVEQIFNNSTLRKLIFNSPYKLFRTKEYDCYGLLLQAESRDLYFQIEQFKRFITEIETD